MSDSCSSEEDVQNMSIDDIDLLNYSSQSQQSTEDYDCDKLLELPSSSQQMRDHELDLKDEQIRMDIAAEEERKAAEIHNKVVLKHQSRPIHIKARAPGLKVFNQDQPTFFNALDLELEKDFGWQGRQRLQGDVENMNNMLGGDMFYFVRYLTPEVTHNIMISSEDDFNSVVNYILFKAVFCKDRLLHSILKKCLFDLLKCYHYPWVFSVDQYLTILLNLGAEPKLINNQAFYESNDFCEKPAVLPFSSEDKEEESGARSIPAKERLLFISHLFQISSEIFGLPGRQEDYQKVDPKVWKTFVFISSVVAQEEIIINKPELSQDISTLLYWLFTRVGSEDFQDIAELLTSLFLPGVLSDGQLQPSLWSVSLPEYFIKQGKNHPHNMLHLTRLLPSHFPQLKQLVCFMNIQLILNSSECDLPSECHLEDVLSLVRKDDNKLHQNWTQLDREEQHYSCWSLLHLLDILVLLDGYDYPVGSIRFSALKDIRLLIEKCHIKGKVKDSLAIDSDKVTMLACELLIRWKNIINQVDYQHNIAEQLGPDI